MQLCSDNHQSIHQRDDDRFLGMTCKNDHCHAYADAPPTVVVSFEPPPAELEPAEPGVAPYEPAQPAPDKAVEVPQPATEQAQPSTQEHQPPLEALQSKVGGCEALEMTVQLPADHAEQGKEAGDVPCPSEAASCGVAAVIAPEPKQGTPRPALSHSNCTMA